MKILTREQVYQADRETQARQGISSTELMERAARAAFEWLHQRLQGAPVPIQLFCGMGNNGGDGLALARHLAEHGYHIHVYQVHYSEKRSPDFLINLEALRDRKIWPQSLGPESELPPIGPQDIIVDALFGIGLTRPPTPWVAALMAHLNASGATRVALDMPSGLYMDRVPESPEAVVRADYVLTFGAPKLPFFLPQTGVYARYWEVLDIGLDPAFMASLQPDFIRIGRGEARALYRGRERFTHKGTYGHALLAGGSYGKVGAVALAARAALKAGAGLVTAWVPRCGYVPLQAGLPEAMVQTPESDAHLDAFPADTHGYAVGVGMGMGQAPETARAFLKWLKAQQQPLLLDADALNVLASHPEAAASLPAGSILTPHPGELRRLLGPWKDDFEKIRLARAYALKYKCVLLVKGAYTLIFFGERAYVNDSGNPGLATGGSGDVLSGVITGLMAQAYDPLASALLGVHLHGLAADILAAGDAMEAITASEVAGALGAAYRELLRDPAAEENDNQAN
ncbi:NAD(P)H-hydrate dehydratase [Robiginitalea sp. M366]|uniref:NAD(P)H-hydrate dehydratase n=1 Tax=Robiginitalea aestuariiviva TaxID=3036903 RepID=UPI00240D9A01|nr:NAD(P)H-hydrate dehydratase [Robiginitalea aestuariiviva]MDG1572635.1 NAD(P)H-hydrate dehydratase [Robiginitalea aestuariiviva]